MLRVRLPDLEYARALDQRRLQRIRVHAQHSASPALRSTISALQKNGRAGSVWRADENLIYSFCIKQRLHSPT